MEKKQLVEVKKGQTGTGLLVESDGYIDINSKENKIIKESIDEFKGGMANELPRPFIVSAVFQKFGIENANGRIYPEAVLKREVEKLQEKIKRRIVSCEMEHPQDSNINLDRVCALVVELHWVGRTLVGKLEIPVSEGFRRYGIVGATLADKLAQWLVSGIRVGVSSRALGSVKQEMGKLVVMPDLEIINFDVVSTPSTNSAWIESTDEELEPYLESVDNSNKSIISESDKRDKYSKFESWLNN